MAQDLPSRVNRDPVSLALAAGMRFIGKGIIINVTRRGDEGYESAMVGVLESVHTLRTGGPADNVTAFTFKGGAAFWVNKEDTVEIQQFGLAQ